MAFPFSVGECIAFVEQVVALYQKVRHEVPDQVEEAGEQVKSIASYLKRLNSKLEAKGGVGTLQPDDTKELENILARIERDVQRVKAILVKWIEGQNIGGFTLHGFVSKTVFALGSSPKELADLSTKLDRRLDEVDRWIQLLQTGALNILLTGQVVKSPSPKPPLPQKRYNINILFVGTGGEGRARVAEAYAHLLRERSLRADHHWPINLIHSVGLYNKARSETVALQESLQMKMWYGDVLPTQVAQAALFDNKYYDKNYPYKEKIREAISHQHTRGLLRNTFTTYDYILCFNRMHVVNLENMKDALKSPTQPQSDGKGQVALLGAYGGSDVTKEIFTPRAGPDGIDEFHKWVKTVDKIKTSFKGFLKTELNWVEPL